MEIKVGEYIRTEDGCIGKVSKILETDIEEIYYCCDTSITGGYEADITKHSHNIIDLVEVGDYVNGKCVFATENRINDSGEKVVLAENYDEWTDDGVISNKDIETILTHELYEANCYKVGGEE